jgi:hypothetical protein
MWLKDLLPHDLPNARILTYGYDADTRSFTQTSTQNITRHAEAFVEQLSQLRSEESEVSVSKQSRNALYMSDFGITETNNLRCT